MEILFPVGRMVHGSLYKPRAKTDNFGKPKFDAQGKPETEFNFALAIPKTPGMTHWNQTEWGTTIRSIAQAGYQAMIDAPTFAWKIVDGDSAVPNKKGKVPNKSEGFPGHWVLWFKQAWAPKLCDAKGVNELTQPDAIMPGDFIQVYGNVKDNRPAQSPGVYLNPLAVALQGYSPLGRITSNEVDTTGIGFGANAPAGMLAAPVGAMIPPNGAPDPVAIAHVMLPAAGGVSYEAHIAQGWTDALLIANGKMAAPVAAVVAPSPPAPLTPNSAFLAMPPGVPQTALPVAPPPPGAAVAPPPAPAHVMLPAAGGVSYEAHIAGGWTDALLIANGKMAA